MKKLVVHTHKLLDSFFKYAISGSLNFYSALPKVSSFYASFYLRSD